MWINRITLVGVFFSLVLPSFSATPKTSLETKVSEKKDSLKLERAREFLERGNQYQEKGFSEKAREYWKIALDLDPGLTEARENLGLSDSDVENKPAGSISDRESVSDNLDSDLERPYGKLVKNLIDRAEAQYRKKQYEEALRSLDQAQKLDSRNPLLHHLRKRVETDYSGILLEKHVREARVQWKEGKTEAAQEILKSVLVDYPQYQPAIDLQGEIGGALKKDQEKMVRPRLQRAARAEENRFMDAKNHYDEVLKVEPRNGEAAAGSERMAKLIDPVNKKIRDLEAALKTKNRKKAEEYLAEIKELSPNHPKLSRWNEKIKDLSGNEVSEDSQAKADTAYNLGLESYRKGDLAAAKKFWAEVLELNPQSTQARRNMDRLLREHPELK